MLGKPIAWNMIGLKTEHRAKSCKIHCLFNNMLCFMSRMDTQADPQVVELPNTSAAV